MLRQDQIGELLLLRLGECRWSEALGRALGDAAPAGVLLSEPFPRSAESTWELLARIARSLPRPAFLAVRQEGGAHDPLNRFLPPLPAPRGVAGHGPDAVTRFGELCGEALSLLGFNTNFAPRIDLPASAASEASSAQTFGPEPCRVAECGRAFLRGHERHHVLACGKHFPGMGSVSAPRQGRLAVSAKPMAALWREDLLPFRELLPHLPMVLISSAAYKAYDFDQPRPACTSPAIVAGLLREKLGYHGLALAYDLESLPGVPDVGQAAVQALGAGCDLLIVDQGEAFDAARRGMMAALESRKFSPERIAQSLQRIRAEKRHLTAPPRKFALAAWKRLEQRFAAFAVRE